MKTGMLGNAHPSRTLVRILVALVVASAFLYTASVIDPGPTAADDMAGPGPAPRPGYGPGPGNLDTYTPGAPGAPDSDDARRGGRASLGTLEGSRYILQIHATTEGPRYTVTDITGAVLAEDLSADEVDSKFPEIDIEGMILPPFAPGSQLMMVTDH
ncbi:MAG: hypothetical protein EA376_01080 [Phycisphaeraceae bacterium]|nr:MAG: hypothetical protein EA376_01080 [Phycisphaeraceae bacterium]